MKEEFVKHGFTLAQDYGSANITTEQLDSLVLDPKVGAVVQGMDNQITFSKLAIASVYI